MLGDQVLDNHVDAAEKLSSLLSIQAVLRDCYERGGDRRPHGYSRWPDAITEILGQFAICRRPQSSVEKVVNSEIIFGRVFLGIARNASTRRWPSSVATNSSLMVAFRFNSQLAAVEPLVRVSKK